MARMTTPDWLKNWRISATWAQHLAWGSLGGIDWATPYGTRILAPSAGTLRFTILGDGSSDVSVTRPDGTSTHFLHARVEGSSGDAVKLNQDIGYTDGRRGVYGAGPSTGPHVHVHDYTANGVRVPPFSTIGSSVAGGGTEIASKRKESDMPKVIKRTTGTAEWSLVHYTLQGPSDLERGYLVTSNVERAKWWARFYGLGLGSEDEYERDEYIAAQASARLDNAAWVASQPEAAIITAEPTIIDDATLKAITDASSAAVKTAVASLAAKLTTQ